MILSYPAGPEEKAELKLLFSTARFSEVEENGWKSFFAFFDRCFVIEWVLFLERMRFRKAPKVLKWCALSIEIREERDYSPLNVRILKKEKFIFMESLILAQN